MPRGRRVQSSDSGSLSPHQASYVLHRMISERRVSPGEVNRYLADINREIDDLERRLESLRNASGAVRAAGASPAAASASAPRRRGRPPGSGNKTGRRRGRPPASAAAPSSAASPAAPARKAGRPRKSKITAEQLASRQLQGRYLGLIRQIPANKRAPYQRTAKERGREAAIREMQDTLKK
jgi:hypothetical protein